jgi:hypothetical protein
MATRQWARLRPAEAGHLRRGAWYLVVRLTPLEAVLEILSTPPTRWTIVPRPAHASRLPSTWGPRYGATGRVGRRTRAADLPVGLLPAIGNRITAADRHTLRARSLTSAGS